MNTLKKAFAKDNHFFFLLILLIAVLAAFSIAMPNLFLNKGNFVSMAKQFPEYGLLAIGIGLAMLSGGIDLSVVSVANLSAIVAALFMRNFAPKGVPNSQAILIIFIGILLALIVGLLCGLTNGFLISRFGMPPILATLGTQQLFAGIAIMITKGQALSGMPALFTKYGNKTIGGIFPVPLLIFIVCVIAAGFVLSKMRFGFRLYMLGTNAKAAKYAGLNTHALYAGCYALSGALATIAGLIMMVQTNSIKADYGISYTLQGVLIAVLGGIDPKGGKGNVRGIVMAILILQVLATGLGKFENISNFYRDIIWGAVLILVLTFNHYYGIYRTKKLSAQI